MDVRNHLEPLSPTRLAPLNPDATDWIQLEYRPDAGHVRFSRPMKSRNEIPDAGTFQRALDYLVELGNANRELQERMHGEGKDGTR
jgi:hypothetical protein